MNQIITGSRLAQLSKIVGFEQQSLPVPAMETAIILRDSVIENKDEESFIKLYTFYRFCLTPENALQTQVMRVIEEGYAAGRDHFSSAPPIDQE